MKIDFLYQTYKKDIYYFLYHLSNSHDISQDLTSEVFLAAIKALPTFRGESDIKTWLFGIARLKWFEFLRKQKREQSLNNRLSMYISEIEYLDERRVVNEEIIFRVNSLLEVEDERAKKILTMRADGFSFHEIGEIIGISDSSARVIDFRVKKKLKKILVEEGYVYE